MALSKSIKKAVQRARTIAKEETLEVGRSMTGQFGFKTKEGGGKEVPEWLQGKNLTPEEMVELQKKRQKEISFFRQRIKELSSPPRPASSPEQEEEKQRALQESAEEQSRPGGLKSAPGGESKRGTALMRGQKKKKGGMEIGGSFARRSK